MPQETDIPAALPVRTKADHTSLLVHHGLGYNFHSHTGMFPVTLHTLISDFYYIAGGNRGIPLYHLCVPCGKIIDNSEQRAK